MTAAASQTHPASLGILTKLNTSMIRIASELTSIPFRKRLGVNRLLNERVGGFLKRARGSPAWLHARLRETLRFTSFAAPGQLYSISHRGGTRWRSARWRERLSGGGGGDSHPIDAPSNLRCPFKMNNLATRAKVSIIARRETGGQWRSACRVGVPWRRRKM